MIQSVRRGLIVLGLAAIAMLTASQVGGQQPGKGQKVKVLGAALLEWRSKDAVYAGINHFNGCAFLTVTTKGGYQEQSWNCPSPGPWGTDTTKGSSRVVGDQVCNKYEKVANGEERCWDVYRVGDIKYQYWRDGTHQLDVYKLK